MIATNHALAGAVIGAFLPLPAAIPVAFASHFVMDSIPHYGVAERNKNKVSWRRFVFSDALLAVCVAIGAIYFHKWDMEAAGWAAYSPDILWCVYFVRQKGNLRLKPRNAFMRFHRKVQQEYAWALPIDLIALAALAPIYVVQLLKTG